MSLSSVKNYISSAVLVAVVAATSVVAPVLSQPVQAASGWKTASQCLAESKNSSVDTYYTSCVNNQSVEGMVYRAFRVVLGRAPKRNELTAWSKVAYANRTKNPTSIVINALMQSNEYRTRIMTENTQAFVAATYKRAYGVAGDAAGVKYWTGRINSTKSDRISQAQFLAMFTQNSRTKTTWSLEAPCFISNYNAKYCVD